VEVEVGDSSSFEPRDDTTPRSSTRRTRSWLVGGSLLGFGFFVAWQIVATAQRASRGDSPSVTWAVVIGAAAAILFIVATIAIMTWPQRSRLAKLRARYPSRLVLPVARVEGSEVAVASVAEVSARRLGNHFVVVISETEVEFWSGPVTPSPWAAIEASRVEEVTVMPGVCGREIPVVSFRVRGVADSRWVQIAPTY
jgi:hypothetical protein